MQKLQQMQMQNTTLIKEPNMNDIIYAFYMTMELWIFLAVLAVALLVEEGIVAYNKRRLVDNPTLW